jgi:hypothetical protein
VSVEIYWIEGGAGLLFKCSGELSVCQLIEAKQRFFASAPKLDELLFALVDGSRVDAVAASMEEIKALADLYPPPGVVPRPGFKVALVFPHIAAFGLARMWEVWAERVGWETRVVRSVSDAEFWLGRPHHKTG